MRNLHKEIELAKDRGRYALVVDKNENCHVYYHHKATMCEFHKEVTKVEIGKQTKSAAMEEMR